MFIHIILISFLPGSFDIEQFIFSMKCRLMFTLFSQYFQLRSENNSSAEIES